MANTIEKYVNHLFVDITENKQLRELKEEIIANLHEKVNDFIKQGQKEDEALNNAISSLGDMNELVNQLKKASEEKYKSKPLQQVPLDRKHIIGYVIASAILLLGLMIAIMVYFIHKDLFLTVGILSPFVIISIPMYAYLGLTQESMNDYPMKTSRALSYSIAILLLLIGFLCSGFTYLSNKEIYLIIGSFIPFGIVAIIIFIYLGLTEKPRSKMHSNWQEQWVNYYKDEHTLYLRGTISGALWIISFALFILLGFLWSFWYSWIVFIFAVGFEVIIEAIFTASRKNK